jgi:hypothetical protein
VENPELSNAAEGFCIVDKMEVQIDEKESKDKEVEIEVVQDPLEEVV